MSVIIYLKKKVFLLIFIPSWKEPVRKLLTIRTKSCFTFVFKKLHLRYHLLYLLVVVEEDNVYESLDNFDSRKAKTSYSTMTLRKKGKHKSSWNITDNFSITLCTVNRLNCDIKRNPEVCNTVFF